jgi:hypothetical protein
VVPIVVASPPLGSHFQLSRILPIVLPIVLVSISSVIWASRSNVVRYVWLVMLVAMVYQGVRYQVQVSQNPTYVLQAHSCQETENIPLDEPNAWRCLAKSWLCRGEVFHPTGACADHLSPFLGPRRQPPLREKIPGRETPETQAEEE